MCARSGTKRFRAQSNCEIGEAGGGISIASRNQNSSNHIPDVKLKIERGRIRKSVDGCEF